MLRYRTASELRGVRGAELEPLERELLRSAQVRTWLDRTGRDVHFFSVHGSKPTALENALGKLALLGCRAGMISGRRAPPAVDLGSVRLRLVESADGRRWPAPEDRCRRPLCDVAGVRLTRPRLRRDATGETPVLEDRLGSAAAHALWTLAVRREDGPESCAAEPGACRPLPGGSTERVVFPLAASSRRLFYTGRCLSLPAGIAGGAAQRLLGSRQLHGTRGESA